jgi:hypothetical protein
MTRFIKFIGIVGALANTIGITYTHKDHKNSYDRKPQLIKLLLYISLPRKKSNFILRHTPKRWIKIHCELSYKQFTTSNHTSSTISLQHLTWIKSRDRISVRGRDCNNSHFQVNFYSQKFYYSFYYSWLLFTLLFISTIHPRNFYFIFS